MGWLEASLIYAFTDARFEEEVLLATPRPTSDCNGQSCTERVRAGSQFPLVPRNRGSAELDFHPYGWLSLSLSGTWVGSQYLRGDERTVPVGMSETRFSYGAIADLEQGLDAKRACEAFPA